MKRKLIKLPNTEAKMPKSLAKDHGKSSFEHTMLDSLVTGRDGSEQKSLFLGRAGEYLVAAELLRRGYNAAVLPVDTGIDILAHKEYKRTVPLLQAEHEVFLFQVKTTASVEYSVSLSVKSIHEFWHKAINLIIVFWEPEASAKAIILPPSLIRMLTSGGFDDPKAPLDLGKRKVSFRVFKSGLRFYIRNKKNDVTNMVNRYDRIESVGVDTGMFPHYAVWSDIGGLIEIE